jgi:hypothetical protein
MPCQPLESNNSGSLAMFAAILSRLIAFILVIACWDEFSGRYSQTLTEG